MHELERSLTSFINESGTPGGVLSWSAGDGAIETVAAGVDALSSGRALSIEAPFRIASLTKIFTGTLALRLTDEGCIRLEEPIDAYLPEWRDGSRIVIRHLLAHTSGIAPQGDDDGSGTGPYVAAQRELIRADPSRNFTLAEVIDRLCRRPPLTVPGTTTRYSNTNSLLLARIAELATGRSYIDLLREYVLEPIGLRATWYPPGEPEAGSTPVPGLFDREGAIARTSDVAMTALVSLVGPAGALVSSARDLATFGVRVLRNRELLSDHLATEAFTIGEGGTGLGVLGVSDPRSAEPLFRALARQQSPTTAYVGFGGSGMLPGTSTKLIYLPKSDTVFALLLNHSSPSGGREYVRQLIGVFADNEAG